jgi:hypothetical protein
MENTVNEEQNPSDGQSPHCDDCVSYRDTTRLCSKHGAVDALIAALDRIAAGEHSDTCSGQLISSIPCDCHVAIARAALALAKEGTK